MWVVGTWPRPLSRFGNLGAGDGRLFARLKSTQSLASKHACGTAILTHVSSPAYCHGRCTVGRRGVNRRGEEFSMCRACALRVASLRQGLCISRIQPTRGGRSHFGADRGQGTERRQKVKDKSGNGKSKTERAYASHHASPLSLPSRGKVQ